MIKETRILMGMPVTVEIAEPSAHQNHIDKVFDYFNYIDKTFSTYKPTSEISNINNSLVQPENYSQDMKMVLALSEKTKQETNGYFDIINNEGNYDPSGLVKGWAIQNAAVLLKNLGFKNFYIEAGGDIQVSGKNSQDKFWSIGIKNPFKTEGVIKRMQLQHDEGVATSGSYERGTHIYNPKNRKSQLAQIVSITVIGPNIYEADRFATAAFAMQQDGIYFIEKLKGFAAYMIDNKGMATMTSNFQTYAI
jgi:thiamine biosynthesis lipoprotein